MNSKKIEPNKQLNWWQKIVRGNRPSASSGSFLQNSEINLSARSLSPNNFSEINSQLPEKLHSKLPADFSAQLSEPPDAPNQTNEISPPQSRLQQLKPTLKQQEMLRAAALKPGKKKKNNKWLTKQTFKNINFTKVAWFFMPFLTFAVLAVVIISKINHNRSEAEFLSEKKRFENLGKSISHSEATIPELVPLANRYSRWLNGGFLSSPNILEWDSALSKVQRHFGWSEMSWSFLTDEAANENKNQPLIISTMRIMLNQKNVSEIYNVQQLLSAYVSNDGPLIYVNSCQTIKNTIPTMSECILEWVTAKPQDKDGKPLGDYQRLKTDTLSTIEFDNKSNLPNKEKADYSSTSLNQTKEIIPLPIKVTPISITPAAAAAKNKTPTVSEPSNAR